MKKLFLGACIVFCSILSTSVFAQNPGLEIGDKAPDIRLASPSGEEIALSSLKGKIVLIDFWATWCAPCLKEQPELAKLYAMYKPADFIGGKGFEIYGVSLDSDKSAWEEVLKKVKISWVQVSDLKYWKSPVAKTYTIKELPFNVLIDGKGIILAKNLHGDDLSRELDKLVIKEGCCGK
jgi:thiol-disulfide isomerase/thioredoxin